jgi:hypothetical protein
MDRPPVNTTAKCDHASRLPTRFGPRTHEIALFLIKAGAPADHIAVLAEVNRRWPNLSLRDFLGAVILSEALLMPVGGRA